MVELAEIVNAHGPEYSDGYHRYALFDIAVYRKEFMEGHVAECPACSISTIATIPARTEAAPKYHGNDTKRWLEQREAELLPPATSTSSSRSPRR